MIELQDIHKAYGSTRVLDGVSLEVPAGAFGVLLGPSGCGKTTLLRLVAGLEIPDRGAVRIGDREVSGPGRIAVAPEARNVGLVFQDLALFPQLTVEENVAFGVKQRSGRAKRVEEMLSLARLTALRSRRPHELSGGEQQRVAVARALAPAPDLLLLDEPFASLDAELRARVRAEIIEILKRSGTTVIMVTHDREEALSVADHLMVMLRGGLVQSGPARSVYETPCSREVAMLLGDGNLLQASVKSGQLDCALGRFPAVGRPDGPCTLFVRSENVCRSTSGTARGRVTRCAFYGHDALAILALDDGTELSMRLSQEPLPEIGSEFVLGIDGGYSIFTSP